jgi:hypothetical protein
MGYMAGDYYAGDYYAGGILSGLGSMVKGAIRVGGGFLRGGPLGAVGALVTHAKSELSHDNAAPGGPSNLPARVAGPGETALQGFVRRGGRLTGAGRAAAVAHKNAALQPVMAHAALMGFGRRRRMNWANARALGRAERRIHSAVKHMTKYIRWVHPAKGGHAVPKFGRRKKR